MRAALASALVLVGCAGPLADTDARSCGSCHVEQLANWEGSAHARSTSSPVFQALLPRVEAAWGATARAQCVACHQPGHGGDATIGCASCHLAIGNRGEANGALVVKTTVPVAGPRGDASRAPHEVTRRGFFESASLCGTCHEVQTPHLVEETLTEYRASSRASEDECASCHFDDHRFPGLEPKWGQSPEARRAGQEAAVALVARALKLEVTSSGEVRLTNHGAAHGVPTGQLSLRDLWVDVTVTSADGARTEFPRVIELGARLERDGKEVSLLTDATKVVSRSLHDGESRAWSAPPGRLEARLMLRAIREDTLMALGLAELRDEVPGQLVATATRE
ncbi:MAG: multiheme c-type cytochrome [Myxococcota bacterium]